MPPRFVLLSNCTITTDPSFEKVAESNFGAGKGIDLEITVMSVVSREVFLTRVSYHCASIPATCKVSEYVPVGRGLKLKEAVVVPTGNNIVEGTKAGNETPSLSNNGRNVKDVEVGDSNETRTKLACEVSAGIVFVTNFIVIIRQQDVVKSIREASTSSNDENLPSLDWVKK